jgi:protein CpxP
MKPAFKSLVVAGLLASAGFAAFSQSPGPMAEQRSRMGQDDKPYMHHRDPAKMEALIAKRSAELKAKLKITAQQESAWTAYTTAMKPPARETLTRLDRAELNKLTTPERIDKMRSLRNQQLAAMDQRDDATKTFYAALNPEQQKIFDSEHARWGDRHGRAHAPREAKPAQPATPNQPRVKQ